VLMFCFSKIATALSPRIFLPRLKAMVLAKQWLTFLVLAFWQYRALDILWNQINVENK
jgi:hypothetical protein